MSDSVPLLSVVVPTFARREALYRLLESLRRQTLPPRSFEVVVVVDGSQDGTREMAEGFEAPFQLRVVWQPNAGRATACNRGIRLARGELVALLDDDMEPAPTCLAEHARGHAGGDRLALLGAAPIRTGAGTPPVARLVAEKFNRHLERLAGGGEIGYRSFYSGNLSISRALLLEVGLFDQGYTEYGNEDTELALRLRGAGVTLRYAAEALAHQHYEKDFPALTRDSRAKGRTAVLTQRKHAGELGGFALEGFRAASPKWTDRSLKWKLLRSSLLGAGRLSSLPGRALVRTICRLERHEPAFLPVLYLFAIDYFYWLGVGDAARRSTPAAPRAASLAPGRA
jgi:glycosyltransferase involved in cell wall biosynthesis